MKTKSKKRQFKNEFHDDEKWFWKHNHCINFCDKNANEKINSMMMNWCFETKMFVFIATKMKIEKLIWW